MPLQKPSGLPWSSLQLMSFYPSSLPWKNYGESCCHLTAGAHPLPPLASFHGVALTQLVSTPLRLLTVGAPYLLLILDMSDLAPLNNKPSTKLYWHTASKTLLWSSSSPLSQIDNIQSTRDPQAHPPSSPSYPGYKWNHGGLKCSTTHLSLSICQWYISKHHCRAIETTFEPTSTLPNLSV